MSPIGSEYFHRLDEFSSFISCIKYFGKPIIPPLITSNRRNELKELRIAAVNKETDFLRRKKELSNLQRQDNDISSKSYTDDCSSGFQSSMPESCALWYPSAKDCQERHSVAISKLPTSGIYSSVHTGAIVCSNVIENSHSYTAAIVRDSLLGPGANLIDCVECSHNNIDLECSLCQVEYNQSFHNKSFTTELSPEVPCRTSLPQQNVGIVNDELNCTVEETDCESLPTVICNQICVPLDTDSESNITYMSQSTDLDKYMEFHHEFSSPDALAWDSKSACHLYTLSRSDDASSETIVNTENELTPCASTMAELTDNIEDELSNADETPIVSDREVSLGSLKRSYSMDSYMKIIQNCAKSMHVKKSLSEPFNTDLKTAPDAEENKIQLSLKTSFLIKEDSKESDESKDMHEKDISDQESKEFFSKDDKNSDIKITDDNSFQKKHIRQHSYTLEEPSSVLILAHADCTCNFDANCISPHCSALKDENQVMVNSAFTKEKVVDIPVSYHQMKIPILSPISLPENITLDKECMTSTVIDVFPVVEEDTCEKSNSGNDHVSEVEPLPKSASVAEINSNLKIDEEEHLSKMFPENFKISEKKKETLQHIYQELQKSHELQLMELLEQQKQHWLKLQEEFKEKERFLYEKIKLTIIGSQSDVEKKDQIKNNDYCSSGEIENRSTNEKELPISNSTISSDQIPTDTSENSSIQNSVLLVPGEKFQSVPSINPSLPQNTRASVSPSREYKTPDASPSKPLENIKGKEFTDSNSSIACNFKRNEDYAVSNGSNMFQNINEFSSTTTSNLLSDCNSPPQPPDAVAVPSNKKCDNVCACFCDKSVKQCKCCMSFNGYCEYDDSNSHPEDIYTSQGQKSISNSNESSDNDFLHSQISFLTSGVQSKNLKPGDFINGHDANNSKKVLPSSSWKSNDYVPTSLAFNGQELPNVNHNINVFPPSLKQRDQLPVASAIVSLDTKTLKNGSIAQAATSNKRKMMDDRVLLKMFEKLPAFVKGYLTRRLLKTEHIQNLIQTLKDTAFLVGKLGEDLSKKKDSVSERDVDLHRQLIVQIMTTFHNVHYILCTSSTKEKMAIIAESRKFRLKQQTLDQNQESSPPVISKAPEPASSKKLNLSSATLKTLERKRSGIDNRSLETSKNHRSRSTIEMRTYTIDDLNHCKGRSHTSMSSKNISVSPSCVYKSSVGCMKRKSASAKSSGSRQYLHQKRVP